MQAVSLTGWGVDTNSKLTAASAKSLAAATVRGQPIGYVWRYVFFGSPRAGDLDEAETALILDAGLKLIVVQHVRMPGWLASGEQGEEDGRAAVANAIRAGYSSALVDENGRPPTLVYDLEGVRNVGQNVFDSCKRWGQAVRDGGYSAGLYVGYACGLSPRQLYQIPTIDRYASDFGPRVVDVRGFCSKQHAQTSAGGVNVDPDEAMPDALGGTLTGLAA